MTRKARGARIDFTISCSYTNHRAHKEAYQILTISSPPSLFATLRPLASSNGHTSRFLQNIINSIKMLILQATFIMARALAEHFRGRLPNYFYSKMQLSFLNIFTLQLSQKRHQKSHRFSHQKGDRVKNLIKQRVIMDSFQRSYSLVKISFTFAETTSTAFSPLIMLTSPTLRLQYSRKGMVCSLQVLNLFRIVSRLSSDLPLTFARYNSLDSRVSSEHSRQIKVLTSTSSPMTFFQASQFSALLGKPSIRQILLLGPFLKIFLFTMSTNISLGQSLPSAISSLILIASAQSVLMNSRRRSPVDKWLYPYLLIIISHCVPLPAPGPPRMKMIFGLLLEFMFGLLSTI